MIEASFLQSKQQNIYIVSVFEFIVIGEYGIILVRVESYTGEGIVPPLTVMHFGAFSAVMESSDLFTISSP